MTWAKKILTDRLYLSVVGVVAVFVVALAYLFSAVLDRPLTSTPPTVKVMLTSTGGLFTGSEATYRGVKVGKVTAIRLTSSTLMPPSPGRQKLSPESFRRIRWKIGAPAA